MSGGALFRINKYMSRTRLEGILGCLRYTYQKDVEYYYGFLHMRKMEEGWNPNMDEEFNPSWINVLDESILEWFNKCASGFMCVGHKPHPLRNESHTIWCGLTSIFWRTQIVEGKYRPYLLGQK